MALMALIDHDNLSRPAITIPALLTAWLDELTTQPGTRLPADVQVRCYGGWWEQDRVSPDREKTARLLAELPSYLEHAGSYLRVHVAFADTLLSPLGQGPAVRSTFARRPALSLGINKTGTPICTEPDCALGGCRKWLFSRRACSRPGCTLPFGDAWVRVEQKQVDTHLVTDLLALAWTWPEPVHALVVSDDLDFLPAILAASGSSGHSISSLSLARSSPFIHPCEEVLRASRVKLISNPAPEGSR